MKYIVISDLHIPERAKEIPEEILEVAKRADGIICAGDFTTKDVYGKLKSANKNLIGVRGNCDRLNLPEFVIFEEKGKKIGVTHSHHLGRGNVEAIFSLAKSKGLDIIIFGHTHTPLVEKKENILLINPGSANGIESCRGESSGKTYGVLELNGELKTKIERID